MKFPRRLYWTKDRQICEEGDASADSLIGGQGHVMIDSEAQRLGIVDYLVGVGAVRLVLTPMPEVVEPDTKAVDQGEAEDKALKLDEVSNKGVDFPPESRRQSVVGKK